MAQNKKILVVEDERPMAHALELKLTKSNFNVRTVFNGEEAIDAVKKEKFDLILLDLMLPQKDGFSVLKDLKLTGNQAPVIVSTNLSQQEDIARAKELGAVGYFVKSNTHISDIIEQIKKILN